MVSNESQLQMEWNSLVEVWKLWLTGRLKMFYVKYDFSSNAKVFPAGNIFLIVKMLRFFYNRTYMSKRPFCNILLTVWFNKSISFSISSSFGTISGDFDIFYYFLTKRSEYMWFISYGAWISLWRLKMVQTGGFQPWNSREPIMTDSRNV